MENPKKDWLSFNPQCKQTESCSNSLSKKCICPKEEPKQTVQEYEQQGLEKYSHELKSKQDYKKLSKKFTEILTIIPDDVLIKYTQQETLEEAAERYLEQTYTLSYEKTTWQKLHIKTFIAGAKSDATKTYWYNIFKQNL